MHLNLFPFTMDGIAVANSADSKKYIICNRFLLQFSITFRYSGHQEKISETT